MRKLLIKITKQDFENLKFHGIFFVENSISYLTIADVIGSGGRDGNCSYM